jgi:NTP pyrophosphatase (non-canonical NTP hydrolase)
MQTTQPQEQKADINYDEFVESLCKPGHHICSELFPEDAHRIHMAMGIAGEAGELLDAIKKATIYRKPYDKDNVLEECGDILFYVQGMLNSFGFTLQDAIKANVYKLGVRYSKGKYTDAQAQFRADKEAK